MACRKWSLTEVDLDETRFSFFFIRISRSSHVLSHRTTGSFNLKKKKNESDVYLLNNNKKIKFQCVVIWRKYYKYSTALFLYVAAVRALTNR